MEASSASRRRSSSREPTRAWRCWSPARAPISRPLLDAAAEPGVPRRRWRWWSPTSPACQALERAARAGRARRWCSPTGLRRPRRLRRGAGGGARAATGCSVVCLAGFMRLLGPDLPARLPAPGCSTSTPPCSPLSRAARAPPGAGARGEGDRLHGALRGRGHRHRAHHRAGRGAGARRRHRGVARERASRSRSTGSIPLALRLLAEGRLRVEGRRVHVARGAPEALGLALLNPGTSPDHVPTLPPRPRIAPGPSRHVYDVLVLGAELGGALAAAMLAKRGLRVLWAEHAQLQPGYEHDGFLFATPPFFVPPFRLWPAVENLFTELGLTTGFQRQLKPAGPMQVVLPRHRLELPADVTRRRAELQREFGTGGARVAETLGEPRSRRPRRRTPSSAFSTTSRRRGGWSGSASLGGARPRPGADPALAALVERAGGGAAHLGPALPGAAGDARAAGGDAGPGTAAQGLAAASRADGSRCGRCWASASPSWEGRCCRRTGCPGRWWRPSTSRERR